MTTLFHGIGVSRGIVIARAHLLIRHHDEIAERSIAEDEVDGECARFRAALTHARARLAATHDELPADLPVEVGQVIDTHLMMLDDPLVTETVPALIAERRINAERALTVQREILLGPFEEMHDPYLRARAADIEQVFDRIGTSLAGNEPSTGGSGARGRILIADDLTPADTLGIRRDGVAGFVTEGGGPLSHTAIVARGLGIPAVVGVRDARRWLRDGEPLILDGEQGIVLASPDRIAVRHFRARKRAERERATDLQTWRDVPDVSHDGRPIRLEANIERPDDLRALDMVRPAGVGLYRTEFLYLNRADTPTEEEHYRAYMRAIRALGGKPLTLRTVDIGSDKEVSHQRAGPLVENPALGLRGIRRCLAEPELFVPQIRAALRAAAHGPVRLMFPMLSSVSEFLQARSLVEDCARALAHGRFRHAPTLPMGCMIETPAAALIAERFAAHADFLSIGTNDLIQYTLAFDRIDADVAYLNEPLHPAVLELIRRTLEAGSAHGIPVSMCGEMAGDSRYIRLLLGMGLTDFSMPANAVLAIRRIVAGTDIDVIEKRVAALLECPDPDERIALLAEINEL